jgi:hypothetical protein
MEITEQDATAEGFQELYEPPYVSFGEIFGPDCISARSQFLDTWDALNAKRGFPCRDKPIWVWVIEFRRIA